MPSVTGAPQGATVSYKIYAGTSAEGTLVEEAVDAGEYFVEVSVSAKNYTTVQKTAKITISKAVFSVDSIEWSKTAYIFTGSEITLSAMAENLPEGFTVSFSAEGSGQALAATEVEGVASMAGNITKELIGKLGVKNLSKGVKVLVTDRSVDVDLALNIDYGYSIMKVSEKVQDRVKSAIENMTGLEVSMVNIRIVNVNMDTV